MALIVHQIPSERMDSNSYLVEEDGHAVIIDAAAGQGILDMIREKGLQADYLLLTHEHFDHIWFLEMLRDALHMPVVACRLCSERIQDVKANLSNISDVLYYFKTGILREGRSESFTCAPAEVVYEEEHTLMWQTHRFDFRRIPGHSPGSVLITLDGSRVFTGDYLIRGEEEITRLKGGSDEDYEQIARPVLEGLAEGTDVFPGHGSCYVKGREDEER